MKRRTFLQGLSAAFGSIPIQAMGGQGDRIIASHPDFDPTREYGRIFRFTPEGGNKKFSFHDRIRDIVLADARKTIPPGKVVEVIGHDRVDYGRLHAVEWRYSQEIQNRSPRLGLDRDRGCTVVAVIQV